MAKRKPTPRIDPEFSALLGDLSPEEFAQLKTNIEEDGQREPIVVWREKNLIVEGNNRFKICKDAGITPKITYLSFPDRETVVEWIFKQQFGRRNVSKERRDALIVAFAREMRETKRQSDGVLPTKGRDSINVVAETAAVAEVSESTVERALSNFCDRCQRVGVVKNCPKCAALRDEKPKKPKPKRAGAVLIDWKNYERCLGVVVRLVDEVGRHYPDAVTAQAKKEYLSAAGDLVELKKRWQVAVKGK